jgi:uncharacterized membrane protein YhaH (DUF805 family)
MNLLAFFEFSPQELLLLGSIWLIWPLLTLFCLIDIIRSNFKDSATKLIWALLVLFMPILGAIAYLVTGRGTKVKSL